jgi:hypothetical protein
MLHKIRQAMARKDQDYRLEGTIIIIDDAFFGSQTKNKKRGRRTKKTIVLVAINIDAETQAPLFTKMSVIENMKIALSIWLNYIRLY